MAGLCRKHGCAYDLRFETIYAANMAPLLFRIDVGEEYGNKARAAFGNGLQEMLHDLPSFILL